MMINEVSSIVHKDAIIWHVLKIIHTSSHPSAVWSSSDKCCEVTTCCISNITTWYGSAQVAIVKRSNVFGFSDLDASSLDLMAVTAKYLGKDLLTCRIAKSAGTIMFNCCAWESLCFILLMRECWCLHSTGQPVVCNQRRRYLLLIYASI